MKNKARGIFAAFLAAVLSVSAGCSTGSAPFLQDRQETDIPALAAAAGNQTGVPSENTDRADAGRVTDERSAEDQQTDDAPGVKAAAHTVVGTTPAAEADELEQQTVEEEEPAEADESDSIPIVGKSYKELYPDLRTDGVIFDGDDDDSAPRISTLDDYYRTVYPDGADLDRDEDLPVSVDNSDNIYFPEVDTQGGIGACTCWAMVYYQFTYTYNKAHGIPTTRDTTFSPRFTYNMANYGTDKGSHNDTVYGKMMRHGCVLWNQYPYDYKDYLAWPTDAELYRYGLSHRLKGFQEFDDVGDQDHRVTSPDDEDILAIKTALANQEVLSYSTHFSSWRGDVLKASDNPEINKGVVGQQVVLSCDGTEGGHAMTLVGYNDNIWTDLNGNNRIDNGEMGAFLIVNSHGKDYGNQGFAWVAYDALNDISCVEGAYNAKDRNAIFRDVSRIDLMPDSEEPSLLVEYTINTDDRYKTGLTLVGNWANTVVEQDLHLSNGAFGMAEYLSYDAQQTATDASVVVCVDSIMKELHTTDINEVTWSVKLFSNEEKGHAITLKSFRFYEPKTGTSYSLTEGLPLTATQESKTLQIHESVHNNAVIYYRGYKNPVIQYSLGTAAPATSAEMWFTDTEKHGYVNKFVIPLGSNTSAKVKFGDGSGRWDDNGGQYYVVKKGDNFFVTPDVGDPLILEVEPNLDDVNDLGCRCRERINIKGGYTPYEYRLEVKDLGTNEIEMETEYKGLGFHTIKEDGTHSTELLPYTLLKETTYQNTIYVRDSAGTVVKKSYTYVIKDEPITFTKFCIQNEKSEYPCLQQMYFDIALVNDYSHGGNCHSVLTIMKDGKVFAKITDRMKSYSDATKKSAHTFKWTPTEGGDYTAIVCRTDVNGDYAFKTLTFKVASNDVKLSSVTVSPENEVFMGEKVQVTAQAAGGNGAYQYRYMVTRMGQEAAAVDYSANASAVLQLPFETGSCDVTVTVKDGNGQTATFTKTLTISAQPRIKSLSADKTTLYTNETITLTPETKNVAAGLTADNFVYTAVCGGQETVLTTNADKTGSWKPTKAGTYTVKLALQNGEQVLTVGSKTFTVAENPKPPANTVRVGVVYYINNQNNASQFQLHYWGPNGLVGDAACVRTSSTAQVSVGSQFWNGAAQEFYMYEATIPTEATGFKFHIGDTWFGGDGSVATSNAVYAFEYGNEYRALYRKET